MITSDDIGRAITLHWGIALNIPSKTAWERITANLTGMMYLTDNFNGYLEGVGTHDDIMTLIYVALQHKADCND